MMKQYIFTILTAIVIAVLSLMPVNELHLENMELSDKWAHTLMYAGLTAVMLFDTNYEKLKQGMVSLPLWLVIIPIAYGGIMELLQAYCTNGNRSGDWLDFIANSIGTILVYALAWLAVLIKIRK